MSARTLPHWTGFWRRTQAMLIKEFIQLRRDRVSFAMIVMIPLMQLVLFGYAINTTPRNLPTAVLLQESSDLGRSVLKAMQNTRYFKVTHLVEDRGGVRPAAGIGHGSVRRRNSARFRTRHTTGRQAGAAGCCRCHRSGGLGFGAWRARATGSHRAAERALHSGRRPAAIRNPNPRALQPGGRDRAQHRAGSGRHHPHHDHADLHRACP